MASDPNQPLRILISPQGKYLLFAGTGAFALLLICLTLLIAIDKATMEDMKGLLGALAGFFFGWLMNQSPPRSRAVREGDRVISSGN